MDLFGLREQGGCVVTGGSAGIRRATAVRVFGPGRGQVAVHLPHPTAAGAPPPSARSPSRGARPPPGHAGSGPTGRHPPKKVAHLARWADLWGGHRRAGRHCPPRPRARRRRFKTRRASAFANTSARALRPTPPSPLPSFGSSTSHRPFPPSPPFRPHAPAGWGRLAPSCSSAAASTGGHPASRRTPAGKGGPLAG